MVHRNGGCRQVVFDAHVNVKARALANYLINDLLHGRYHLLRFLSGHQPYIYQRLGRSGHNALKFATLKQRTRCNGAAQIGKGGMLWCGQL
jgi:hypothetical protein